MARAKSNGRLEEALTNLLHAQATLAQNQASFLARAADSDARMAASEARMAASEAQIVETNRINSERFARIEAILMEHSRILGDHTQILQSLTDAIREKIGFKPTGQPGLG